MPARWNAENDGLYYVSQNHPQARDENNPNGWPGRPRRTIPAVLDAGSVVWVAGAYDTAAPFERPIISRGTAAAPVFIRGPSPAERPTFSRTMAFAGSFLIVEHIVSDVERDETNVVFVPSRDGTSHHLVLRHAEIVGDARQITSAGIAAVGASDQHRVDDAVFLDVDVHDQGNVTAPRDPDAHCAVVGAFVARFWLLDSKLRQCAGDGLQANPGQGSAALTRQRSTHHIYVGRNTASANRQSGFWAKNVTDVIFSQNTVHGITRSASSPLGQCMGGQYGPSRLWMIFNTLYDCETAVAVASTSGLGEGSDVYIIGNVIRDIGLTGGPNDPTNSSSRAAMSLWDIPRRFIVDNTIWRTHSGIKNDGNGLVTIAIHGNIIGQPSVRDEREVWVPDQRTLDDEHSEFSHNLVGNRVTWGRTGKDCHRCSDARPRFVNEAAADFRYTRGSAGIDASVEHPVYVTFTKLYGLDIRVDHDSRPRPAGRAWDIGAFEFVAPPAAIQRFFLAPLESPRFHP